METEEATNPAADEDARLQSEEGVADEAQAQGDDQTEDQSEESTDEADQAEDDHEEIEHEGAKYRVPKAVKPLLMMQADYTRKTQEVAELRRTVEARQGELQQQAEAQNTTLEERATLKALDAQLSQYQNVDWQQYTAQYGAEAAVAAMGQARQLEAARAQLNEQINSKEQEHRLKTERAAQTALQEADQLLAKEVPGYGPELVQSVAKTAQAVGFSAQELRDSLIGEDGRADTRSFKVIARLAQLEAENAKLKATQQKAQTAQKQTAVTPAKTVGQKTSGYKPGLDDSLPMEEWNRRFQAQMRKRA